LFVDVDSSKLDLSKELANDFSSTFDSLIDPTDLQLTADDFVNKYFSNLFLNSFLNVLFDINILYIYLLIAYYIIILTVIYYQYLIF